jgi:hypothetical protein
MLAAATLSGGLALEGPWRHATVTRLRAFARAAEHMETAEEFFKK